MALSLTLSHHAEDRQDTSPGPNQIHCVSNALELVLSHLTYHMIVAATATTIGVATEQPDLISLPEFQSQGTFWLMVP